MRIFRAVGLGMLIVMLQFLVPGMFFEFERTMIVLFETTRSSLMVLQEQLE